MRGLLGGFKAQRGAVALRVHLSLLAYFAEELTVLGQIYCFRGSGQNRQASGLQTCGKRQQGPTAELNAHALDRADILGGLLDLEQIFGGGRHEDRRSEMS